MSEILDFQAGREARINGAPRDKRRNAHWLRGWDQVNADEAEPTPQGHLTGGEREE